MIFSDTTTKLGLIQDCEQEVFGNYGDISDNSNRLYDFTARLNRSYDKAATKIMSADGRWQWDDTNYTDLPIGRTDIVSGQQNYSMDVEHLEILKVVCTDSAGVKHELIPYSINDPLATIEVEALSTQQGIPTHYRKNGVTFTLYNTPNYNYTNGLIIYFQRKPSYFAYTDTTKSPGLPAIFHRYLSLDASLDYAVSKQLTSKNDLAIKVKEMEDGMVDFYSKRSKDESKIFRPVFRSSR